MPNHKVLLTGATGYIASQLLPAFREQYELTLLDVKEADPQGNRMENVIGADLVDPNLGKYTQHFQGVDTVVHLGYQRRRGAPLDDFYDEQRNVAMAYNVYRAAYESGVRRVVVASSNHAADWYEHALIHARKKEILDPYELPLSDNFYGWAKATYEHLGFLFACGTFGRKLEVVMVRIGAPREIRVEDFTNDPKGYKRDLGAYISPRDLCQLFTKAVDAPNIENQHGIPWLVVYGISDNTRSFWSLSSAREILGYQPDDDSEVKYAEDIHRFMTAEEAQGSIGRVGP
ncbi:MAG: NAD-dependent epimerase/dehydratase family protein [Dehalococcoidia bacterium]